MAEVGVIRVRFLGGAGELGFFDSRDVAGVGEEQFPDLGSGEGVAGLFLGCADGVIGLGAFQKIRDGVS